MLYLLTLPEPSSFPALWRVQPVYIEGAFSADCAFSACRISNKLRGIRDVRKADLARLLFFGLSSVPCHFEMIKQVDIH